ncbi:MAG: UDP-galactopyranose mutase [Deltaproteobacteria bacterium]|nr:MAG: UDP-galactopyranose mutase [Deltaproteobacteria bacterium]
MPPKSIVVGAGIAGLSAAVLLARTAPNHSIEVWEASEDPGGLLAPISFHGIPCDRGSHRVHPNADPLLLELTQREEWQAMPRRGKLVLNQRHIGYPLRLFPFLKGLGPSTVLQMGLGFLFRPTALSQFLQWEEDRSTIQEHDEGFEQFVVERVGQAAYQQFYRPYVEKVWGLPPSQISRTVAKQRVSTSSPWQTVLASFRHDKAKSSPSHFLYPKKGMASLIDRFRLMAEELGVTFRYGQRFALSDLSSLQGSSVFYSGHLTDCVPDTSLSHRGLYLLHLAFPDGSIRDDDTYYTPESRYWFGRVSQLEKFSPELSVPGKQILCVEIPEGQWGPKHDFVPQLETIRLQLQHAGILQNNAPIEDCRQTFLPRVYPMYRRGWLQQWRQAIEHLKSYRNFYPIGRQGLFLHCNMDHCVRISHDAVQSYQRDRDSVRWLESLERYLDLRVRD